MPALNELQRKLGGADVQVVGISCDTTYALKDWAQHLGGLDFPLCSAFRPPGAGGGGGGGGGFGGRGGGGHPPTPPAPPGRGPPPPPRSRRSSRGSPNGSG